MPVLDGLETTKLLKEKFEILDRIGLQLGATKVIRPLICHLTQFDDGFK